MQSAELGFCGVGRHWHGRTEIGKVDRSHIIQALLAFMRGSDCIWRLIVSH